jgi:hypothetical protein
LAWGDSGTLDDDVTSATLCFFEGRDDDIEFLALLSEKLEVTLNNDRPVAGLVVHEVLDLVEAETGFLGPTNEAQSGDDVGIETSLSSDPAS